MGAPDLSIFDLSGKKALVTGGSRGIGRAIAEGLARAGADVAVAARLSADLNAAAAAIEGIGGRSAAVPVDVSQADDCVSAVSTTVEILGGLDILVNNAGTEQVSPSLDVSEAIWDKILDTNLKGAFFCAQAAAKAMQSAATGGAIINICSLTSEVGIPTAVPYGSSKSGLLGMTRALAVEWAPLGIRVNGIAPGYFRTALTEKFFEGEDWQKRMLAGIPIGRFGQLDDLVGAAIYLASPASAYVTGHCLAVDGGYLASI
jgi:NAD(P)-dependent dehydrogenase (short-subunit alcohol dehydrogenase family)